MHLIFLLQVFYYFNNHDTCMCRKFCRKPQMTYITIKLHLFMFKLSSFSSVIINSLQIVLFISIPFCKKLKYLLHAIKDHIRNYFDREIKQIFY